VPAGRLGEVLDVGSTFMDGRVLCRKGDVPIVCGYCLPFFAKDLMIKLQKVIISPTGAYSISKAENRAWLLLNPPTPPFVVLFSDAQLQHLIWRASVTLDPNYWRVQMGPRSHLVNRRRVLEAVGACRRIAAAHLEQKGKQLRSPFISLDPELGDLNTGILRPDVRRFAASAGLSDEMRSLEELSPGDLWAIGALLFRMGAEVQPEAIRIRATNIQ
jgi:CRISPR type IV-associated protein Csf1